MDETIIKIENAALKLKKFMIKFRNMLENIQNSIKFLLSGNTAGILAVLFASL